MGTKPTGTKRAGMKRRLGRVAQGGRAGSALLASLMIVIVISGLGVVMVQLHSSVTKKQVQAIDQRRAFYVAEAGLSEAFLAVSQGKSGNVGSQAVPASFGRGLYWVEAAELDDGDVALFSTGLCGTGRFAVSAVIRRSTTPLASLGVFADSEMVIEAGVQVDGFDSDAGSFETQALGTGEDSTTGAGARLCSNGDIVLESSGIFPGGPEATAVFGDLRPGPNAAVLMGSGASVTGSTAPAESVVAVPPVSVPALESEGELVHAGSSPAVLTAREVRYDRVRVESGSALTLEGPLTLVVGALELAAGAELIVDTSTGPVCVYCTESCDLEEGSVLSASGSDPTSAALFITASDSVDADGDGDLEHPVRIRATGEFHGAIYVPSTTLSIPSGLRLFGAVAADRVVLEAGARISVDEALAQKSAGVSALPRLICWRIVALPDTPLVSLRLDPKAQLQLKGVEPTESHQAHLEDFVSIEFFDTDGELSSYEGPEAAFDWSEVGVAITTEWSADADFDEDGTAGSGPCAKPSHGGQGGGGHAKPSKPNHEGGHAKPHKLDKPHKAHKPHKPQKQHVKPHKPHAQKKPHEPKAQKKKHHRVHGPGHHHEKTVSGVVHPAWDD